LIRIDTMTERIKQITQQTGISLVVVLALVGLTFQAGSLSQRVVTLEERGDRTAQVLSELFQLTVRMDRRLILLEDRSTRGGVTKHDGPLPHQDPAG
jgi:hypothetical protein